EDIDIDVEPRADARELGRERAGGPGHDRLRRTCKEALHGQPNEAVDHTLYAYAREFVIVVRLREHRVVAADRKYEVAGMVAFVPDGESEIAIEAEDVRVDQVAVLGKAGFELENLVIAAGFDPQLEVCDVLDAKGSQTHHADREFLSELDRDHQLAVD